MALGVLTAGALLGATAVLPLWKVEWWWVRVWDFPRLQLLVVYLATLPAVLAWGSGWPAALSAAMLLASTAYQLTWVAPYLPLPPFRQVRPAASADRRRRIRVMVANVQMDNRRADLVLAAVRQADPDVLVLDEPDAWWVERLAPLDAAYPYGVKHPRDNFYGKLLLSRLPVLESAVRFLVEPDVPSIRAVVRLPSGDAVELLSVHPRPPRWDADSDARDAELVLVGREARRARRPVIVMGDMNDVGWSPTSRLFQKVSGLLDPRRGRGLYATFPARWPLLRFPLDHVFHSAHFRLVALRVLGRTGSDHLPFVAELSLEPERLAEQPPESADPEDRVEARERLGRAGRRKGGA